MGSLHRMERIALSFLKNEHLTPARIIIFGFMLLILTGAGLLMLPISTVSGEITSFVDALFTATSATCVTGLVVFDTATYWSGFGQAVILVLIQIGGMGVVTMSIAIVMFAGKKIGLKQRWVMQESISAPQVGGIVRMTGFIFRTTLILEGLGALLLALRFCPQYGLLRGIWYAVFHAVSAFCNAGYDLMGVNGTPFASLTGYVNDPLVNIVITLLIILGGIGFLTWADVKEHGLHLRAYRLQSKLICTWTLVLLVATALYFFFYEFSLPQWDGLSLSERALASWFQSVTPRTAGFNTVDLANLSEPSQLVTILLMLIGGAPGSTAGGFKVTTLAVLLLFTKAVFFRKDTTQCYGRRIPESVLRSAVTIFLLYLCLFLTGGMLICGIEGVSLIEALFEAATAVGTVGLTLGITSTLSVPSQLILIFLMYFGRVGGLTLIYAMTSSESHAVSLMPQERVTVG